jgi:hypothetical protein
MVSLDDVEKRKFFTLPGLELRTLDRSARSQELPRLCSPDTSLHSEGVVLTLHNEKRYLREYFGALGIQI